jgi:hypothetical protein
MKYAVEMASCGVMYVLIFMKNSTAIQAILKFCLINLNLCNTGVTDGKELRSAPLRLG